MSQLMSKTLTKAITVISKNPGLNAYEIANAMKLRKQKGRTPRRADGTFSDRNRHLGYDLVRRTLLAAETRGDVESLTDRAGKRRWFVAA